MRIVPISSLDDERLSFFTHLTDVALRRMLEPDTGLYLAESTKVIERALAAGHRPVSVITLDKWLPDLEKVLVGHDVEVFVGDDETLVGDAGVCHDGNLYIPDGETTGAPVEQLSSFTDEHSTAGNGGAWPGA